MSKPKLRNLTEICADCGAPDVSWASINRGILICDECCSIHRSLGRHVSYVKSLKKGVWSPSQRAMVYSLHNGGANSVWEYSLLDPGGSRGGRKKPAPKDPLHPVKADFIRAKHQNHAFVYRPSKDDGPLVKDDVNKQLHSSVRTGNLETSLRFLSIGADPNYVHPEKGNTPLHVAAKSGQLSQVELLFVYGADPACPDKDSLTPVDYAREAGHVDLADRLVECQYELTDRLAFYLCGRKPDHRSNQYYIIPEMTDSLEQSELAITAKRKLQSLPNNLLEELAMDVYDEVDRRETDAIWLSMQNQSALVVDCQTVPFLPVNPDFSSTRNQGRQKLARFNAREFAALIIDILTEVKQRQQSLLPSSSEGVQKEKVTLSVNMNKTATATSDEEPLYDSVASDEDYVDSHQIVPHESAALHPKEQPNPPSSQSKLPALEKDYNHLKKKLFQSEMKIHHLQQQNKDMKHEISLLQNMVQKLMQENMYLRYFVQQKTPDLPPPVNLFHNGYEPAPPHPLPAPKETAGQVDPYVTRSSPRCSQQRPQSMYEPRERQVHPSHLSASMRQSNSNSNNANNAQMVALPRDDSGIGNTHSSHSSRDSGDYDNTSLNVSRTSLVMQNSSSSSNLLSDKIPELPVLAVSEENYPSQDEVFRKTEQITKKIQELLISAQEGRHQSFIPCSEKVYRAVLEMASIFPQNPADSNVHLALKQLTVSAFRLQAECQSLRPDHQQAIDYCFVTQQVIQCAYDIAKAAKQLVTLFQ